MLVFDTECQLLSLFGTTSRTSDDTPPDRSGPHQGAANFSQVFNETLRRLDKEAKIATLFAATRGAMADINLESDIRPISDLKRQASALVDQVTTSRRPVVLTRHGRGVAVLVSVREYEELRARADRTAINAAIAEAEADVVAGRVMSTEQVAAKHRARYASDVP